MDNTIECTVCLEPYNNKQRRMTECPSCQYKACASCMVTYFTTSKASPQCMDCHRPWTHQYMRESIGGSCLKRIQEAQKNKLFMEQKLLIPYTQEFVQLDNESKKLDAEINRRSEEIKRLKKEIAQIEHNRYTIYRNRRYIAHNFNDYMVNGMNNNSGSSTNKQPRFTEPKYIQACSQPDCKGFVKINGVCGLCETTYCKECMNVKTDDTHECNENDVLTVQMLRKDTKPCPKCSNPIHRISGCPDMFCVSCCTAFNWNTLKIDERGNSNPHYYAWLRNGSGIPVRNINGCQDVHLSSALTCENFSSLGNKVISDAITNALYSIHHRIQNIWEFKQSTSGRGSGTVFRFNLPTSFESHTLLLRARYMMNEISESNFKSQVMRIHKALEYNENIEQIKNTITGYRQEMMRDLVYNESFEYKVWLKDYVKFVNYINDCVDHLRIVFYEKQKVEESRITFIDIPRSVRSLIMNL